ncbi:MAG: hypothetical protein ACJ74Y_00160 [Bryobacteraceae bacterium]
MDISMWIPGQIVKDREVFDETWGRELAEIETAYGRLVYLASLRDCNSGRYEHYATEPAARKRVHSDFLRLHEAIFREWVDYTLERKKADIELYIRGLDSVDPSELVDAWLRLTPYKNLVPTAIRGPEREQHISDFEAILGLLRNVYGVASPDRLS